MEESTATYGVDTATASALIAYTRRQVAAEIAAAIEGELEVYGSYADQVLTRAAKIARDIGGQ